MRIRATAQCEGHYGYLGYPIGKAGEDQSRSVTRYWDHGRACVRSADHRKMASKNDLTVHSGWLRPSMGRDIRRYPLSALKAALGHGR
jgi:hypothetical protein